MLREHISSFRLLGALARHLHRGVGALLYLCQRRLFLVCRVSGLRWNLGVSIDLFYFSCVDSRVRVHSAKFFGLRLPLWFFFCRNFTCAQRWQFNFTSVDNHWSTVHRIAQLRSYFEFGLLRPRLVLPWHMRVLLSHVWHTCRLERVRCLLCLRKLSVRSGNHFRASVDLWPLWIVALSGLP